MTRDPKTKLSNKNPSGNDPRAAAPWIHSLLLYFSRLKSSSLHSSHLQLAIVIGCFSALFLWLFRAVCFEDRLFVFRDVAHFYYPLFELVQAEWGAGRIPLWNPYENSGMPLLGNATSSVLYPAKLIFALPFEFSISFRIYILFHVLLAGWSAYQLARHWNCSVFASGVCAISYAFCGNVLFQYCNVVFLCGAAWLPLTLLSGDLMLSKRSYAWAIITGITLCMMILSGDPQMAYMAGLLLAGNGFLLWRTAKGQTTEPSLNPTSSSNQKIVTWKEWILYRKHRLLLLSIAGVIGFLTAAVQILPTWEFSQRSIRATHDLPRNIYEVPAHVLDSSSTEKDPANSSPWYAAMLGTAPELQGYRTSRTRFSVGPWRLIEFVWPNISGTQFPTHRRWLNRIPAEGSIWVPSMYMGVLPFLLAIVSFRLWNAPCWVRWISWMVVFSVLASFGNYGLIWLWKELNFWKDSMLGNNLGNNEILENDSIWLGDWGDEVGGLYWLLVVFLPGFAQFRYPGKLMVIAALGLSVLSAVGWDRLWNYKWNQDRNQEATQEDNHSNRELPRLWLPRLWLIIPFISCALFVAFYLSYAHWASWVSETRSDSLFGPLEISDAGNDLIYALFHSSVVCLIGWMLVWFAQKSRTSKRVFVFQAICLCLIGADLALVQGWMIPTVAVESWRTKSTVVQLIEDHESSLIRQAANESATPSSSELPPQPYRVYRVASWMPKDWAKASSVDRQQEGLIWDRDTLYPKYGLQSRTSVVETSGTLKLYDYDRFFTISSRISPLDGATEYMQPRRAIDAWNSKYLIIPIGERKNQYATTTLGLRRNWLESQSHSQPQSSPTGTRLEKIGESQQEHFKDTAEMEVLYNPQALPRAWIVHRTVTIPPLNSKDRSQQQQLMQAMVSPQEEWIDLRQEALIESEDPLSVEVPNRTLHEVPLDVEFQKQTKQHHEHKNEQCIVTSYQPQRVEIKVTMQQSGVVVLSDVYYPGWMLEVESEGKTRKWPILKTNRMMRGAALPQGKHKLIYSYHPTSFYLGGLISGVTWGVILLLGMCWLISKKVINHQSNHSKATIPKLEEGTQPSRPFDN